MLVKRNVGSIVLSLLLAASMQATTYAQTDRAGYEKLLRIPMQYAALSTTEKMMIDGKADERAWRTAPWTVPFTDIETGMDPGKEKMTRCKMLWDAECLYVYAEMDEQDLWASLTQHDDRIFQDNAFEIFINPDGTTFNYFEFQINANNAVWDLFMPKPYRSGGRGLSSWNIEGLRKAVRLNGTLNNMTDRDSSWSIELAIPFKSLRMGNQQPQAGTVWRMNFSRVEWDLDTLNGQYMRRTNKHTGKLLPEHYCVWSPQGLVNLHYPERWGYVLFADTLSSVGFLSEQEENLKLTLWKYYYLQQQYRRTNGKYAETIGELDKMIDGLPAQKEPDANIRMFVDAQQFWIQGSIPGLAKYIAIDQEGEVHVERTPG